MILHALTQYYQRKAESDGGVAPEGFENKEIPFIIVIDKQGKFIQLEDTRELKNKKKVARTFLVPKGLGRSGRKSYEVSNLLWDHSGYVLGYSEDKDQERVDKQHASFTAKVNELKQALPSDEGVAAVAIFLVSSEEKDKVFQSDNWKEYLKIIKAKDSNISFRLVEESVTLVCQSKMVQDYLTISTNNDEETDDFREGTCLITGKKTLVARKHYQISGVHKKPTPFCAVDKGSTAFHSYGKKQGFAFPVSKQAMFEYTTALNTLLAGENRFRIGDVTAICRSAKPTP